MLHPAKALLLLVGLLTYTTPGASRLLRQTTALPSSVAGTCKYTVQDGDYLSIIGAALDIDLDTLRAENPGDLTSPGQIVPGRQIIIPCGGSYDKFFPITEAGCFFEHTIDENANPTLYSLVTNPPNQPGPFTIKGIWTANMQALGIDLTQPGAYVTGQDIYLPTCGHTATLTLDYLDQPQRTGCSFEPGNTSGAAQQPVSVSALAAQLGTTVQQLQALNPGRNLQPDTVLQAPQATDGSTPATPAVVIPCPYHSAA